MFKRTIILVVAVLILNAISDWKRFKEQVSPLIEPIRNWAQRQSTDDEDEQNAKSELIKRRDVDEEESPSKLRWPDDSDSLIVELDESRETPTRASSPTSTAVERGESGRLFELREQLMELNRRDEKARKGRLERIQAELWEAQHEVELLKRESLATGDSSELKVKIRLANNRVADLRALRDQLISTIGE